MDADRTGRGVASAKRRTSGTHSGGIPPQQRIHLAFVLSCLLATAAIAQDIKFDPTITQEEFHQFSLLISQSTFASPVDAAESGGLLDFDIGVAVTAVPVDDTASFWVHSVSSDITTSGYLAVPRLVVSKGLGRARLFGSYAEVPETDFQIYGGGVDFPIVRGGLARPTMALRGTYTDMRGVDAFDLKSLGAEVFVSMGFGPVTPYAAAGVVRTKSEGQIHFPFPTLVAIPPLEDEFDQERFTVGVRFSLLVPKIVIEATQADEVVYSAKVSLGL